MENWLPYFSLLDKEDCLRPSGSWLHHLHISTCTTSRLLHFFLLFLCRVLLDILTDAGADGDLQVQLKQTLNNLQAKNDIAYETKWVKGHQDDNGDMKSLSPQGALNVGMDNDTKHAYLLPQQWRSQRDIPVFRAECCVV